MAPTKKLMKVFRSIAGRFVGQTQVRAMNGSCSFYLPVEKTQYLAGAMTAAKGSVAVVYTTGPEDHFRHLFVAYQASIAGFGSGCRPLLGLDGTHLRSKYVGTLLVATAVDGDGAL
uniref:Uncharacterized protein n=1 Tax=Peronospora matthiolae TaxID=2874970 RepID=A0AAV1UCH8_9STRA